MDTLSNQSFENMLINIVGSNICPKLITKQNINILLFDKLIYLKKITLDVLYTHIHKVFEMITLELMEEYNKNRKLNHFISLYTSLQNNIIKLCDILWVYNKQHNINGGLSKSILEIQNIHIENNIIHNALFINENDILNHFDDFSDAGLSVLLELVQFYNKYEIKNNNIISLIHVKLLDILLNKIKYDLTNINKMRLTNIFKISMLCLSNEQLYDFLIKYKHHMIHRILYHNFNKHNEDMMLKLFNINNINMELLSHLHYIIFDIEANKQNKILDNLKSNPNNVNILTLRHNILEEDKYTNLKIPENINTQLQNMCIKYSKHYTYLNLNLNYNMSYVNLKMKLYNYIEYNIKMSFLQMLIIMELVKNPITSIIKLSYQTNISNEDMFNILTNLIHVGLIYIDKKTHDYCINWDKQFDKPDNINIIEQTYDITFIKNLVNICFKVHNKINFDVISLHIIEMMSDTLSEIPDKLNMYILHCLNYLVSQTSIYIEEDSYIRKN